MEYKNLQFNGIQDEQKIIMPTFVPNVSAKMEGNQEFIKKIEPNLNGISHTIFKVKHKIKKD
eukprot:10813682-Ditylum_brightwellii.AAC.1